MATKVKTVIPLPPGAENHNAVHYKWSGLANGDVGEALEIGAYADISVQVVGTFGVGGTISMRGSNLAAPNVATTADWATHADPQGNDLNMTSGAKLEAILEAARWFSPKVTGGDGTTSLDVYVYAIRRK